VNATRIGAGDRQRLYVSTTATTDETGDLDYIAIEHAINGEPVSLTTAEKVYTAQLLDSRGLTPTAIGRLIGSDPATIRGWKTNGWQPAPTGRPHKASEAGRERAA
jgi:hypothetical protein